MRNFVYQIRCTLWSIAAELEYSLYPWKTKEPPQWAIERYNVDHGITDTFEDHMYYGWLKNLEERTAKLQLEMIAVQKQLQESEK